MSVKRCSIDGGAIRSLGDLYDTLARQLPFPPHFGRNLDALWDVLSTDIRGPIEVTWHDAAAAEKALGPDFARIDVLFRELERKRDDVRVTYTTGETAPHHPRRNTTMAPAKGIALPTTKAKGIALTIGLNLVDPKHYQGWDGQLTACEADAEDMADIAKKKGFSVTTLLTKAATRAKVTDAITKATKALKKGDIFMISYSGHGGQLPDMNNDEPDGQDETWCLYDGELVDDELYALYGKFAAGVRILVFSDSCHSGTVAKTAFYRGTMGNRTDALGGEVKYRAMPADAALRTYRANKAFYDKILSAKIPKAAQAPAKASILLISGCQDNQLSQDGAFNGLFTGQMLKVWKHGLFKGDYLSFHKAIVKRMPPDQTPNFFTAGTSDPAYEKQKPFTV